MSAVHTVAPRRITTTVWDELAAGFPAGLLLLDQRGVVLAANAMVTELLGIDDVDLFNNSRPPGWAAFDDFGAPLPSMRQLCTQALRADQAVTMPFAIRRDGLPWRRLLVQTQPVSHAGRPCVFALVRPVEADLATTCGLIDPLTGLPGRALLLDRIGQALLRARTLGTQTSLVLAGIRGMRKINDEFTFSGGDELLITVATRLRNGMRADHTVSRLAGDTFAILAEHPQGTAGRLAGLAAELIEDDLPIGEFSVRPKAKLGWATSDGSLETHELITLADERMHHGEAGVKSTKRAKVERVQPT